MELITDVLAIVGYGILGSNIPALFGLFSSSNVLINKSFERSVGISFALIAASAVLGS